MFLDFPYLVAGFGEEEWEAIPRTDKVLIRDYHLHGGDVEKASLYNYYETDYSARCAKNKYRLRAKPLIQFSIADFSLPLANPMARTA